MVTVVITAGGTIEPIDGVRGITNFSSGRLGAMIADALPESNVILIKTRKAAMPENKTGNITIIETTDTQSVQDAIEKVMSTMKVDFFIHSMAISDYTVDRVIDIEKIIAQIEQASNHGGVDIDDVIDILKNPPAITEKSKISSSIVQPLIYLKQTPKIISTIKTKWPEVKLVAFKLLNNVSRDELITVAMTSAKKVNADYVVANDLQNISKDQHKAMLIDVKTDEIVNTNTKQELAMVLKGIIEQ